MKAAVLTSYGQPFEILDVPRPVPGQGEVLVRVEACGVCGSDHFLQQGGFASTLPIIPGHEASGVVVSCGPGVDDFRAGDRVAIYYIQSCGQCKFCLRGQTNICPGLKRMGVDINGAIAEYVAVPARNLIPLPERLSFSEAAVLTDAVATPYHALRMAGVGEGDTVVVLGVGGIGSNAIQLAKLLGATVIAVSRSPSKQRLAEKMGADETIGPDGHLAERIRSLTGGLGADAVLQCAPSPEMDEAGFACLAPGGRMVTIAANQEPFRLRSVDFIWGEKTIVGSRGFTKRDIEECIRLYESGRLRLSHLLDHQLPLEKINQAMDNLSDPNVVRTVIRPHMTRE